MNNKISFAIVFAVLLLACVGTVSAYDINIDSFSASTVPPALGVQGVFELEYSNIGALNNFQVSSGYLEVDFGDGTIDTIIMPALTNTAPLNAGSNTLTHIYTTAGTYTVTATYIPSDGLDTNLLNNDESFIVNIQAPVWAFDIDDFSYQIVQGFSETHAGEVENTGTTSGMVTLQVSDLVGTSGTISANDLDINVVGTSGTTFLLSSGNTKYFDLEVDLNSNPNTGTYSGTIEVVEYGTSNVLETGTVDVLVLSNGLVGYTNTAPSINSISTQTATVGSEFIYQVTAVDAENDPIYYDIITGPSGMYITTSGEIRGWTPSTTGQESVVVEATDLMNASTESFTVDAVIGNSASSDLEISSGEILFGGSSQDRDVYVTEQITIRNDGNNIITGISLELLNPTGSSSISSVYDADITTSNYPTTLNPGVSMTITVEAYIPDDFDAGERLIGTFRAIGTEASSGNSLTSDETISMQARSYLSITDVEFEIDGDSIDEDELLEGEDITVIVTLENTYGSSGSTIEDVYFTIEDNLWEVDEDSNEMDLDDGDDEEFTVTFSLDELMNDESTTLVIRAYGDDEEDNFEHYDEFEVDVEIEREDDDIRIKTAEFDDATISTMVLSSEIEVEIQNYGNDDQEDVEIKVESLSTGISYSRTIDVGDLDSGDDETETFIISLPSNLNPGTYQFRVTAGNDDTSDSETITLTVASSTVISGSSGSSSGSSGGVTVTPSNNEGSGSVGIANPVYGQSASDIQRFTDSKAYTSILLVLALLAIISLLFLVIASSNNSRRKKAARRRAIKRRKSERQSIQVK